MTEATVALRHLARARAQMALRAEQAWGNVMLPITYPPASIPPSPNFDTASEAEAQILRGRPPDLFGGAPERQERSDPALTGTFSSPPAPRERRIALLRAMDEAEVQACDRCTLCQGRTRTVFGEGDPEARLMFIGEGPGETEDQTGRPFVGRAGELLNKMISGMGLKREQIYIANVVKCRPPNNRVPTLQEVETCTPYLHKQIEWIRPQVIVTLGLPATRHLLKSTLSMGRLRGQWSQWRGIRVMPTYHPAYLLRSYTEANRRTVWGDLQLVMAELGLAAKGA